MMQEIMPTSSFNMLKKGIPKKINLFTNLSAITADNINTNAAIRCISGAAPEIDFNHTIQVNECVARVIGLAAKEGLKVFGEFVNEKVNQEPENPMDIYYLVDPPNVNLSNRKTIYKQCHGLVTFTRVVLKAHKFLHELSR